MGNDQLLPYWQRNEVDLPDSQEYQFINLGDLDQESKRLFWYRLTNQAPGKADQLTALASDSVFQNLLSSFNATQRIDITDLPSSIYEGLIYIDGSPVIPSNF